MQRDTAMNSFLYQFNFYTKSDGLVLVLTRLISTILKHNYCFTIMKTLPLPLSSGYRYNDDAEC